MRFLLAFVIWPPLWVASIAVLFGIHEILGVRLFNPETNILVVLFSTFIFATITTFLVLAKPGAEVTFQWLFFAGILLEIIALIQIFSDRADPKIWDPYQNHGFIMLGRQMVSLIGIIYGTSLLLLATIFDLNRRRNRPG